jgi:hypothetical protein
MSSELQEKLQRIQKLCGKDRSKKDMNLKFIDFYVIDLAT